MHASLVTAQVGPEHKPPRPGAASEREALRRRQAPKRNVTGGERIASFAAGTVLLGAGLLRRGALGALAALAGGTLVHRGATGRCALYRTLGIDRTRGVGMERDVLVSRSITVGATREAVRSFLLDPASVARLSPSIAATAPSSDRWRLSLRLPGGRAPRWDLEIVEEGDRLEWRSLSAPVDHALRMELDPALGDHGTRVLATLCVRPPGGAAGAALAHGLEGLAERRLGQDLARMKQLLETGEVAGTRGQPSGARSLAQRALEALTSHGGEARA